MVDDTLDPGSWMLVASGRNVGGSTSKIVLTSATLQNSAGRGDGLFVVREARRYDTVASLYCTKLPGRGRCLAQDPGKPNWHDWSFVSCDL